MCEAVPAKLIGQALNSRQGAFTSINGLLQHVAAKCSEGHVACIQICGLVAVLDRYR